MLWTRFQAVFTLFPDRQWKSSSVSSRNTTLCGKNLKWNGRDHGKELFEAVLSEKQQILLLVVLYIPKRCVQHAKQSYISYIGYSQTGCSFDGNFANFRRNIGILVDSLRRASCNRREQVAQFIWYLVTELVEFFQNVSSVTSIL